MRWALPGRGKLPRPRIVLLSALWVACFVGLSFIAMLPPLEGALTDAIQRGLGGRTPSGDVWILRLDDEGLGDYAGETAELLWRGILARAEADGIDTIIDLDIGRRGGLARVLATRTEMTPRIIVPSRILTDPVHERLPWVEEAFPAHSAPAVPDERYISAVLNFSPDVDGVWRTFTTPIFVGEARHATVAERLVAETRLPSGDVEIAFNGPAAVIPSVAAWRFLDADLGDDPPWSGCVLVIAGDPGNFPPVFRTPHGERVAEPWVTAQLAEALGTGRVFAAVPLWCVCVILGVLFLVGAGFAEHVSPRRGGFYLAVVGVALMTVIVTVRVQLFLTFPLSPVLPTLVVGFACGMDRRHRVLQDGLATTLMGLRSKRILESLGATLDLTVLHLTEILAVRGVAVLVLDRGDLLEAAAHRYDPAAFTDEVRSLAPELGARIESSESYPIFYSRHPGDTGWIIAPLTGRSDAEHWLLLEPDGFSEEWWQEHRDLAGRLLVSLALQLRAPDADAPSGEQQSAESLLHRLQGSTARTKSDRALLLDLQQKVPDGLAVCDLIGRQLHHNRAFAQLLDELEVRGGAAVPRLIERLCSAGGVDVWSRIRAVVDGGEPWQHLATTYHADDERTFRLRLEVTDLTREEDEGQLEVLLLQVSELTGLVAGAASRAAERTGVE